MLTACGATIEEHPANGAVSANGEQKTGILSPAGKAANTQLYWGDLHVHSMTSFDSYSFGNKTLTAADAFRFARGEAVTAHTGEVARLSRPLDFLLVSDHAEFMGMLEGLQNEHPMLQTNPIGRRWSSLVKAGDMQTITNEFVEYVAGTRPLGDYLPKQFQQDVWNSAIETAERFNEPGEFTAFIGYEWTAMIKGRNLHRNVLFRDGAEKAAQQTPFSALSSNNPEQLWNHLSDYEEQTGGRVMAIPHNSNLSAGMMFDEKTLRGSPLDAAYAQRRAYFEPVVEVTQVKGDSETHPLISPNDEFSDFENWDKTDIGMNQITDAEKDFAYRHSYARPALGLGLRFAATLGQNPYQFGMLGSTDSHTALATADDDNFFGKFVGSEPTPERLTNKMGGAMWHNRTLSASGYAAVWATENSRAALFDALERREVYATTGPRITVRFFAGWDFTQDDAHATGLAERGYSKGVPMGSVLSTADRNRKHSSPSFIVSALKDPEGANLDRVQIVKSWEDDGEIHERVYEVAWAGERTLNASGTLPPLPSTVDVQTASYANTNGASALTAHWRDPDFDSKQHALYYARVLEILTPRWTTYDAVRFEQALPQDVPAEIQARAYTSPIWFQPSAS